MIVTTFHQLHHLLEQSLREFQADSNGVSGTQEQELSEALQRLKGQLQSILDSSSEPQYSDALLTETDSPSFDLAPIVSSDPAQLHFMTSSEGVVLMANDAACDALEIDLASMGKVSLAGWVPEEEWRIIRNQLGAPEPPQGSVTWVVTLVQSGGSTRKFRCVVTPMLDQSRKVTTWHWGLRLEVTSPLPHPFAGLVQNLEAELLSGQSMDVCLTRICEGLVQTFGFPFVWMATVREGHGVRLRAHAVTPDLDWEAHGALWWSEISQQDGLAQASCASDAARLSRLETLPGGLAWHPSAFQLQEALCLPLAHQGDLSSLLVVCSAMGAAFDSTVMEWLRALGFQIERLMARGLELEQLRLRSAVVGSVNDPMCVTDLHGHLEWVNEAYSALLGVSPPQVLGSLLNSFPFEQLQNVMTRLDPTTKDVCSVKTEIMAKGKAGESLVLEQVLTPLVNEQGQLTHFVAILHDVTDRKVSELQMRYQAFHDPLTDLPNRIMFQDRLEQALAHARRNGTLLALFFLDLDNFKPINDKFGHQTGDRVLRVVAKRLMTCVRYTDTVSRLSGDEFTVILQGLDRIQDIRQVAQKILECLSPPIRLGGQDIPVQISMGIAVSPKDSTDPQRLLEIADQAMYRAKEYSGQSWYFATSEWNVE